MELPKFRNANEMTYPSRDTSMKGAFVKYKQRPQTIAHQAPTHNTNIRLQNPEMEASAALSEYSDDLALLGVAGQLLKTAEDIDVANQTMRKESAAAEGTRLLGEYAADEIMRGGDLYDEATGERGYENSLTRYNEKAKEIEEQMLEKYRFDRRGLIHDYKLKMQGANAINTETLNEAVRGHKIDDSTAQYKQALLNTVSIPKRIELHKQAYNSGLLNKEGYEELVRAELAEGQFREARDAIKQDRDGYTSAMYAEMMTTDRVITQYGEDVAESLREMALERLAHIQAGNYFYEADTNGSVATLNRKMAEAYNAKPEELLVRTEEEAAYIKKKIEDRYHDMKRIIDGKNKESAKASQKASSFDFFDRTGRMGWQRAQDGQDTDIEPATRMGYSPETVGDYEDYVETKYGNFGYEDVFSVPELYEREVYNMEMTGHVADHFIKSWHGQLASSDVKKVMQASDQISRLIADRRLGKDVRDQIIDGLPENLVDTATMVKELQLDGGAGSKEMVEEIIDIQRRATLEEQKANRQWELLTKTTGRGRKGWDAQAELAGLLDKNNIDLPDSYDPSAVKAWQDLLKHKLDTGRFGYNGEHLEAAKQAAFLQWLTNWGVEKEGDQKVIRQYPFNALTGSLDGSMTPIGSKLITMKLIEFGRQDILDEWNSTKTKIVAKPDPSDPTRYYLQVVRPDGRGPESIHITDENSPYYGNIIDVTRDEINILRGVSEKRDQAIEHAQTTEQRMSNEGKFVYEKVFKPAGEWLAKDFKMSRQTWKNVLDWYGDKLTEPPRALWDFIQQVRMIDHNQAKTIPIQLVVSMMEDNTGFQAVTGVGPRNVGRFFEDAEANDIMWKRLVTYKEEQLRLANERNMQSSGNIIYSPMQIEAEVANWKILLDEVGIDDPAKDWTADVNMNKNPFSGFGTMPTPYDAMFRIPSESRRR